MALIKHVGSTRAVGRVKDRVHIASDKEGDPCSRCGKGLASKECVKFGTKGVVIAREIDANNPKEDGAGGAVMKV
jgi:hypothetical protein